jgi:TonB family protein
MNKKYILCLLILFVLLFTLPATAEVTVIKTQKIFYPLACRRRQEEGIAKILITVGEDGAPINVRVLESTGYERLDQCAVNAIKNWLFLGVDEGTEIIQPVEFKVL